MVARQVNLALGEETTIASTSNLSAKFNDFLFATVCDGGGEMPLSVVSALARLDLDPWTEAAALARMPADGATRRLSSLLVGVVDDPLVQLDRATVAARLVALLPTSRATAVASPAPVAGELNARQSRLLRVMYLVFLASMAASVLMGNLAPRAGAPALTLGTNPAAAAPR